MLSQLQLLFVVMACTLVCGCEQAPPPSGEPSSATHTAEVSATSETAPPSPAVSSTEPVASVEPAASSVVSAATSQPSAQSSFAVSPTSPTAVASGAVPKGGCDGLAYCACRANPKCEVKAKGCLCACDFGCPKGCKCVCGGGEYLGCKAK